MSGDGPARTARRPPPRVRSARSALPSVKPPIAKCIHCARDHVVFVRDFHSYARDFGLSRARNSSFAPNSSAISAFLMRWPLPRARFPLPRARRSPFAPKSARFRPCFVCSLCFCLFLVVCLTSVLFVSVRLFLGVSGSIWEHLGVSGSLLEHLGVSGSLWQHLGASWSTWVFFVARANLMLRSREIAVRARRTFPGRSRPSSERSRATHRMVQKTPRKL